jgi:GNAT superfamily N-acetyltransferase
VPTAEAGAFEVPAALGAAGLSLRPQVEADFPFLRHLFRTLRWDELAPTLWPDEAKTAFLDQQFRFQHQHYAMAYDGAEFYVIEHRAAPIGRFYVDRTGRDRIVIEITLLPDWRGRGIGTALLNALQGEVGLGQADRVCLQVLTTNPARVLYKRLGFVEAEPPEEFPRPYIELVWPAP